MKKNILAIAIASAVATPVAFADAPTVYGQINLAIDSVSIAEHNSWEAIADATTLKKATSNMDVKHRNSRLGVKGSEDLGNGLKAVYQMEATVDYGTIAMNRNTFAGIAGGFGTVLMGRHDTPLRMIQPNDGFADSAYAGNNTSKFNGGFAGEDRLDEVVAYVSPSFNGIQLAVALSGQDNLVSADATGKREEQTLNNAMSYSLSYGSKSKGLYAAVAMTTTGNSSTFNAGTAAAPVYLEDEERGDITRATVQYNDAGLTASFMYNAQADSGNSMTVGVAYKMGAMTPRAKVAMITYDEKFNDNDSAMNMAVGVDYAFGKNTSIYAEYASLAEGTRNIAYDVNKMTVTDAAITVMSVGLLHKF